MRRGEARRNEESRGEQSRAEERRAEQSRAEERREERGERREELIIFVWKTIRTAIPQLQY